MVTNRTGAGSASKSGQAMIELAICMVAMLVVLGFLFQIGLLGQARTHTMHQATEEATEASIRDSFTIDYLGSPEYIREVTVGDDGSRYSQDDDYTAESPSMLNQSIVSHSDPSRLQQFAGSNRLSDLAGSGNVVSEFEMVRGHDDQNVEMLPVVRGLLYQGDSIEVESEVFMPWLRGIY